MKQTKLALVVVSALVCLVGLTSWAWAGGAGGVLACCVADRLGIGHIELEGTVAIVYNPGYYCGDEYVPANVDVKLRLEKGRLIGFFELNLREDIYGLDNFEIGCLFLNPNEPEPTGDPSTTPRVQAFVDDILATMLPRSGFNHTNRLLVLTRKSISDTDGSAGAQIPGTDRVAAMGDVKIYVVDPARVKWEDNPNCLGYR
jgi:hypothetical protein